LDLPGLPSGIHSLRCELSDLCGLRSKHEVHVELLLWGLSDLGNPGGSRVCFPKGLLKDIPQHISIDIGQVAQLSYLSGDLIPLAYQLIEGDNIFIDQ
jgi:hypothetical protein